MNKLYVEISGGYNDESREYEISNELAELLKQWAHRDEQADDEKTSHEVELYLSSDELDDLRNNTDGLSGQFIEELKSICDDADYEAYELAVASFLETDPPTEFFFDESMPEDIEDGLFIPSLSFEQYLKDTYEEDDEYDDDDARNEYYEAISDEYVKWVDTLNPIQRANRYGLESDATLPEYHYTFEKLVIEE